MWLAGRIVCNSRACPASKFEESVEFSIVPATGLHSESKAVSEGYLQSKEPPTRIFSQFLVFRIGLRKSARRNWRFTRDGRPYCCAHSSAQPKAPRSKDRGPSHKAEEEAKRPCHSERFYREEPAFGSSWRLSCSRTRDFPMWKSSGNPVGSNR